MFPMTESGLEDIIKDLCKMVIVNMFHKGIVLEELLCNQHPFHQDNNNSSNNNNKIIIIHINSSSFNNINSNSSNNSSSSFNLLHILINILLILVQLLEHPQRAPRTKT